MTDSLIAAAQFLAAQLEWIRHATDTQGQPYALAVFDEIAENAHRIRRLVDGPQGQKYLGPCGAELATIVAYGPHPEQYVTCDGDVYGRKGANEGRCRTCEATVSQAERIAWLDGEVRGWAFRASEIEDAYGVSANLIRQWATPARGLLAVHGHDVEGRALYLLAKVLDVAAGQAAKRAEAQAKRARRAAESAAEHESEEDAA